MGWNTSVLILNDALNDIENDPHFTKKLVDAISKVNAYHKPVDVSAGCSCAAATVIESHHADSLTPILVGGNAGQVMGDPTKYHIGFAYDDVQALKEIARSMGFRLVRDKKK